MGHRLIIKTIRSSKGDLNIFPIGNSFLHPIDWIDEVYEKLADYQVAPETLD